MDTTAYDSFPYVLDVWAGFVERDPERVCMIDDAGEVSRGQLDAEACRIHRYLTERGIGREDVVAVRLPRGHRIFAGMLGVWKAGAALVIVDAGYAQERVDYILENCAAKLLLDEGAWSEAMAAEPLAGHAELHLHDACFIVYTSGSTGNPKGVVHEYGKLAMSELTSVPTEWPNWDEGSVVGVVSPLNFVAAVKLGVACFYNGWTMLIVPTETVKNPNKLKAVFLEHKVTDTFFSPSIIRATGGDFGPYLKRVITGSEPSNGIEFPGALLINNYGMSEASFVVAQYLMREREEVVPVGRPLCDSVRIRLLGEDGREVGPGERGEICFENPYFRGYIGLPEQTEKVMRGGVFHTEDIGVWREDGNLVLVGRASEMIKINGNRVEPGEVEAHARKILGSDWVFVRGFQDETGAFLCLYCTKDVELDVAGLKAALAAELPRYMVPTRYVQLDEIPLLANNKVNKKALPKPELSDYASEYAAPTNELEARLCEAFAQVLGLERVGIDDDFFQMGGDSVRIMQVLAELDDDRLEAADIYDGNTARNIAKILVGKAGTAGADEVERDARTRRWPLLPTQNVMANASYNAKAANSLTQLPTLYAIDDAGRLPRIEQAVNEVLAHHPIFSTVIEREGEGFAQRYDAAATPRVQVEELTEAELKSRLPELTAPVVELPQMYQFRLFKTEERGYLLINKNHVGTDGMGRAAMVESFARAYLGEELLPDYYYTYLSEVFEGADPVAEERRRAYTKEAYLGQEWTVVPEPDLVRAGEKAPKAAALLTRPLGVSYEELDAFVVRTGISRNTLVDLCCCLVTAKLTGAADCLMAYSYSNRTSRAVANSVSCVFEKKVLAVRLGQAQTMADVLASAKEQVVRGVRDCSNELLAQLIGSFEYHPVSLSYETSGILGRQAEATVGLRMEELPVERKYPDVLHWLALEEPDEMRMMLCYDSSLYSEGLANEFVDAYLDILQRLVALENPEAVGVGEFMGMAL
jgi:mycobactin peptide synthetase MbtE